MKIKSLLSFFVPAALMALMVASCSDYDNGFTENAIKFQEDFRKAYGDIDPEQDWNLAERGTVTVSTLRESEVKIYALRGNEYVLVGDYEGVNGTRMLGFDMVEGTTSIMVTDGVTAEKTVSGGVVAFGGTRTVYEDANDTNHDGITVTQLWENTEINGETYDQYRESNDAEIHAMLTVVPEGFADNAGTASSNLNKVTHDFTYVSNGSFIIYPFYWNTSSVNTIGVYYTDADGYHEVPIYTANDTRTGGTNELWYEEVQETKGTLKIEETYNYNSSYNFNNPKNQSDWTISNNIGDGAFHTNGWSEETDDSGLRPPFIEYYKNNDQQLGSATISKTFSGLTPNADYLVEVKARLFNENSTTTQNIGKVTMRANDGWAEMTRDNYCTIQNYRYTNPWSHVTLDNVVLYTDMDNTKTMWVKCKADNNGRIAVSFELNNVICNWFAFNGLKIYERNQNANWAAATGHNNFSTGKVRGQGIRVDIPEGTLFGMYLNKTDDTGTYTFYSETSKNDPLLVGNGVRDRGDGTMERVEGLNPCHASTFYVGEQMFIGFEDWPGKSNGDFDLNDLVLAFDGSKPTIINEEAESWLMVCEDLGGSFDTDYNDVIFKVEHVSGKETAKVTAMAAGGTLASYIVFNNPNSNNPLVIGEIHQMLGAAPEKSGEYTPINANSRYEAVGSVVEIPVPSNFTMTYSTEVNSGFVNMGGFEIRTLNSGEGPAPANATVNNLSNSQTSIIAAPDEGSAPYMLCLPYTYTKQEGNKLNTYVWAWPQELCTICSAVYYQNDKYSGSNGGAYPDFGAWVSSYSANPDWYKNPNPAGALIVEPLLLKSEDIQQGGNNGGNNQQQKEDPTFGSAIMIVKGNSWGTYTEAIGNRTINMTAGDKLWIAGEVNNVVGYIGSVTSFSAGGTNSTYAQHEGKTGEYMITTDANVGGTITMVLHYSGNDRYNAKDITITINTTKTVKFVHNNLALSYVNGDLKIKTVTDGTYSDFQKWNLISANEGDGFYYLYNVGAGKYLWIEDLYTARWSDTPVDKAWARFSMNSNGYIYTAYRSGWNRFFGSSENWADDAKVSPDTNPDANNHPTIDWNIQNAD